MRYTRTRSRKTARFALHDPYMLSIKRVAFPRATRFLYFTIISRAVSRVLTLSPFAGNDSIPADTLTAA